MSPPPGRVAVVAATRQAALDDAYRGHPECFPNGPPRVRLPPAGVDINPIVVEVIDVAAAIERRGRGRTIRNSRTCCLKRVDTLRSASPNGAIWARAYAAAPAAPATVAFTL